MGEFIFKGGEIGLGMLDGGDIGRGVRIHMPRDDNDRLAGGDFLKIGSPYRALLLGWCISGPDMDPREDQYAAEHGLECGHPEITAVDKPIGVNDLDGLVIDLKRL